MDSDIANQVDGMFSSMARSVSDNSLTAGLTALTTAAAVGTAAYYMTRPRPIRMNIDVNNQSIIVDEEQGIRMSVLCTDRKLKTTMYEDVVTLYDGFLRGLKVSNNGPCLGTRKDGNSPYEWISYQEVYDRAKYLGSGVITALDQKPTNNTFIGICSKNNNEWVITDLACASFSIVLVPLYDTLGLEACAHIMNETEMEVVVCETDAKARDFLSQLASTPKLKSIIVIKGLTPETVALGKNKVNIVTYDSILEAGRKNPQPVKPPKPSDLATICYTSGTTGSPKGVQISHHGLLSSIMSSLIFLFGSGDIQFRSDDVHISYLPLAHMFERTAQALIYMHGGRIGFFRGDIRELMQDMVELKPTLFCTVPRLLNRLYDKVQASVSGSTIKTKLFHLAVNSKMAEVKRGVMRTNTIWDYLMFSRIQNLMGGRIRLVMTGSAPLSEKVLNFCRAAFGCQIYEGYGQTECSSACTCTVVGEHMAGHVGAPLPCNYIKLTDVPDMGLVVKRDGKGEVCVKGDNVMIGYYKQPEKTKEAIDSDGWLHTGDIGTWLPNGALKIVDRCKHLFKLSQGEYIAPEKIESTYTECRHVAQVFVEGNSLRSSTVAIVVPDIENVAMTLRQEASSPLPLEELTPEAVCANPKVRTRIYNEMIQVGKENGLKGFEQVKAIYLSPEQFSIDNGLLTPTMKSRRQDLRKYFAKQINELYIEIGDTL